MLAENDYEGRKERLSRIAQTGAVSKSQFVIGRKKCSKKSLAYRSDREHCRCNKTQRQIKFMETVFDDKT